MTRLVLLPGLGADARLFEPQRRVFPDLTVLDWLGPTAGETLPAYGRRMAGSLPATNYRLVLGGVSFGGMVACEMARHLPVHTVALIASARSGAALTRTARSLARSARRAPPALFAAARPFSPLIAWAFGPTSPEARALVREFVATADFPFIQWGLGAIADWRPPDGLHGHVRALHGRADRLIPARRVDAERIVPGAGHLVNLTHADEVNDFLRAVVLDFTIREASPADRERVRPFYVALGHSGLVAATDRVLLAERDGEIVGAVRLCVEHRVQVLRTMRVRPDAQRSGVGSAMLRRFRTMLDGGPCYCLPYGHLTGFYGIIGFEEVAPAMLPAHLAARLAQYRAERPGVDMIAMRRP
jgi:pimeloyl-ACP methyl ester carboxylesterase/N-acetylglutamate synthase-like GNAT family acetyltransferase